jgi:tetratricopeptide (TPR) repeat protein
MEKRVQVKNQHWIFWIIILILAIFLTYVISSQISVSKYNSELDLQKISCQSDKTKLTDFLREYSVALNDIYIGNSYLELSMSNFQRAEEYVLNNETPYVYEYAVSFFDTVKEQSTKSKDFLDKAKNKLESIRDKSQNELFSSDVENRIEQINLLTALSVQYYNLGDYKKQELYEVNLGSQSKATEYFNKANALIPEINSNLKQLSDVQNKIDLQWDKDWYPTFQESPTTAGLTGNVIMSGKI